MLNLVANGPSGYTISNSLRFRSSASASLTRTPASTTNQTTWTWSSWVKRGTLGAIQSIFASAVSTAGFNECRIDFTSSDTFELFFQNGSALAAQLITTQVFRDPSAWYHIVVVSDTTQATSTNRLKVYVNGSQVTSFGTATYPAQNATFQFNKNVLHTIGAGFTSATQTSPNAYFTDGYLTEVNFIDGQALTPSSFGSTNSTTGVWQPAKYTGTYGTNGFYLPFKLNNTSTYGYLFNTTPSYISASSSQAIMPLGNTTWSIECFVYFNAVPSSNVAFIANTQTGGIQAFYRPAINTVEIGAYGLADVLPATTTVNNLIAGNWNHVLFTSNGTQLRIFFNGVLIGYASSSYSFASTQGTTYIGTNDGTSGGTLNGYISNLRVCNGSIPTTYQTSATTIGQTIFTVPTSNLTTSSQGANNVTLLTAQSSTVVDNSSSPKTLSTTGSITASSVTPFTQSIFDDASGNSNNWFPNNINYTTAGTTYDAMTDVPTLTSATAGNFPTINPLNLDTSASSSPMTYLDGNLKANSTSGGTVNRGFTATMAIPANATGKYYFEFQTDFAYNFQAVGLTSTPTYLRVDNSNTGCYAYQSQGNKYMGSSTAVAYGGAWASNDIIGVAYDGSTGTLTFYKNNTSQGSAGTLPTGVDYFPMYYATNTATTNNAYFNFGQRPFTYTPPSGYVALNTYNLPTSTIVKGNKYMDATTYTGTGASLSVTNAGAFQPDFVWIKGRSGATDHALYDSVRGTTKDLVSNSSAAETTQATGLTAFGTGGFTVGALAKLNTSTATYVGWQWQAGQGSSSSNTNGSITSTVSVNASAGFSVVTWTCPASGNFTIGHGLGVTPAMMIMKSRSSVTAWGVWHKSYTNTSAYYQKLNTTDAQINSTTVWANTAPTSTVWSMGTNVLFNPSDTCVAYCWAEIAGFSKFGSYTGNGSTDGPFVYTGFRPKFVMYKRTDAVGPWILMDSLRATYNVVGPYLTPNLSDAEGTATIEDFLSNGFKIRSASSGTNGSGETYIYMAFAENPFKNSLAR